jgi:hypothetical protein
MGIGALLLFGCFLLAQYRPRSEIVAVAALGTFLFLSLYPAYIAHRTEMRTAIWRQESMGVRAQAVRRFQQSWSWFDVTNVEHLRAVEERLNQNGLLGAARRRVESGQVQMAAGETIGEAFLALIPRIIWPDKPGFGGSRDLVSRFTGTRFAEGTSVGFTLAMEFYVNFDTWGVVLGFGMCGALLAFFDVRAGRRLVEGNFEGTLLYWVAGQTLVNVGGNLAAIPPGMVGAALLTLAVTRVGLPALGLDPRPLGPRPLPARV